ncbi:MAG: amidohydrolase family protein [Longimicrobiales bacterium]
MNARRQGSAEFMGSFRRARLLGAAALLVLTPATPLAAQDALVVRGGTVHPVAGESFVADVVIEDGVIVAVGPDATASAGAQVIDASGLHVYPGMFDAVTELGLTEIGSIDVTEDINELGDYTPHLRAMTAIHPASEHIPVARANGITHALVVPGGGADAGGFPGQGAIIHLDGWTVEEMLIKPSAVLAMNWPSLDTREFNRETFEVETRPYEEAKEEYDRGVHALTQWFDAARHYIEAGGEGAPGAPDLRLAAIARALNGEIPVLVRAESERQIRDVIAFAQERGLDLILAGAGEASRVADLIASENIPVILGPTQSMPSAPDAPYDESYANPGKLHAAGVEIAFATFNSSDVRTLPYEAAMAIPYGLPRDAAFEAITLAPAEIFGLDARFGSIEPGKVANLIVTDGDPLEITTQIRHLIIDGREVSTMNRHLELYQTYRARPTPPNGN